MTTSPTTYSNGWTEEDASPSSSNLYPQFLLFGDSITQACNTTLLARLSDYYSRKLDVINRGFSGYTAPMALSLLPHFLPNHPPSPSTPRLLLTTIFFGANDACLPGEDQHVPLPRYRSALSSIARNPVLLHHHRTNLIFITPPPVDEYQLAYPNRSAAHTKLYAEECRSLASDMNIPCLDLWTIFMTKAGFSPDTDGDDAPLPGSKNSPRNPILASLLADGLHFTTAGYDLLYTSLINLIETQLPDLSAEKIPVVFPDWKDLLGISEGERSVYRLPVNGEKL